MKSCEDRRTEGKCFTFYHHADSYIQSCKIQCFCFCRLITDWIFFPKIQLNVYIFNIMTSAYWNIFNAFRVLNLPRQRFIGYCVKKCMAHSGPQKQSWTWHYIVAVTHRALSDFLHCLSMAVWPFLWIFIASFVFRPPTETLLHETHSSSLLRRGFSGNICRGDLQSRLPALTNCFLVMVSNDHMHRRFICWVISVENLMVIYHYKNLLCFQELFNIICHIYIMYTTVQKFVMGEVFFSFERSF